MMEGPRHQHLHQERQEPLEEPNHFFSVLPFGGDARALAGVLHACYRFPLTPITRGVENWNLSWQL